MSDRYKGGILSGTAPTVTPQSANGVYTTSQQYQYQGQGVWPTAAQNPILQSLRFRSSASAYLNRTGTTATNGKTCTYSFWLKRGVITASGVANWMFTGGASSNVTLIGFNASADTLSVFGTDTAAEGNITTAVFRDPAAWYHFVIAINTTEGAAADRAKIYVNGVQQAVSTQNGGIVLDSTWGFNTANVLNIGRYYLGSGYLDGYLTEINFIDGQPLTPTSFGTTDAYGIWQPIRYSGTYGTNGFYLPFTNTTSTSTLGNDFSGNSNTWTVNNISLTSGSTYDSMTDVPTNTNSNTANYCVLNPLSNSYSGTTVVSSITDGNLNFSDSSSNNRVAIGSMTSPSGKWYFEMTSSSTGTYAVGLMDKVSNAGSFYRNNGTYSSSFGGGGTSGYSSWTTGDVIGVAWDANAGQIWFAKNNTWQLGSPSAGTNPTNTFTAGLSLFADIYTDNSAGTKSGSFNFGQRPFTYTPPTGFNRLNTYNLPVPTIPAGNKQMDATIWTGDNTTPRSIANAGSFQPNFVWIKSRSNAYQHNLYDSVRGAGAAYSLSSDQTAAEGGNSNVYGFLSAFNSTGFAVTQGTAGGGGAPNGNAYTNQSGSTYVGWQWKAGGAAVTNTAGTISSQVSANTTSGFSVVTYTGNGTAGATWGHGLGVAPSFVIVKGRTNVDNWMTWHTSYGGGQYFIELNTTNALGSATNVWNNTVPNSSVVTVGTGGTVNTNTTTYVAYCFAQIAGYSAFGSYTGNGSADGHFFILALDLGF